MRDILERASARETAARVAAGALARQFLAALDIHVVSHVFTLGAVSLGDPLVVSYERSPPSTTRRRCTAWMM